MGYKGHSVEPENVAFISSFPLYTDYYYITINGKNEAANSDLLYRGAI